MDWHLEWNQVYVSLNMSDEPPKKPPHEDVQSTNEPAFDLQDYLLHGRLPNPESREPPRGCNTGEGVVVQGIGLLGNQTASPPKHI